MTTKRNCQVHEEECGEKRPAVRRDRDLGWLCAECSAEVARDRGNERANAAKYDAACGY